MRGLPLQRSLADFTTTTPGCRSQTRALDPSTKEGSSMSLQNRARYWNATREERIAVYLRRYLEVPFEGFARAIDVRGPLYFGRVDSDISGSAEKRRLTWPAGSPVGQR
jgi:hypothetical protein